MKIKQYLSSPDIEMIKLGLEIIRVSNEKEKWLSIVREETNCFSFSNMDELSIFNGGKFYVINKELDICDMSEYYDLWSMKQKVNMPLLSLTDTLTNEVKIENEKFIFTLPLPDNQQIARECGENDTKQ